MKIKKTFFVLTICSVLSVGFMIVLYLSSKQILRYHNNFIRIFPRVLAEKKDEFDLKFNSFYFAGISESEVFLGNTTTPLKITIIDSSLKKIKTQQITLDRLDLPFQSVQVSIISPNFFVYDGTVACFYKGSTKDWKAILKYKGDTFISVAESLDSTTIAFRGFDNQNSKSILGSYSISDKKINYNGNLLQKQKDGIFDSDGLLHFDVLSQRLIYVYRYRNQYFLTDKKLQLESRGNTIDTISTAQIKVEAITSHNQQKMSVPPLVVNKSSAVYNNLLFVNSMIMGRFEPEDMWEDNSIIDVYDLNNNSYLYSFYIYPVSGHKLRSFRVSGNILYALIGNSLVTYKLNDKQYKK